MDTLITILVGGWFVILGLYVAVRVASAAFFKSKQDYERKQDGRPQTHQPRP